RVFTVLIVTGGAAIPSAVAGFKLADELATMGYVARNDRSVHLAIAAVALVTAAVAAGVSISQTDQSQAQGREDDGLVLGGVQRATWGPVSAFFGAPLLIAATLIPFAANGPAHYILVDFRLPFSDWAGSAISWWFPTGLIMM